MKKLLFSTFTLLSLLFSWHVFAQETQDKGVITKSKFLEALKVYSKRDLVLNDTIEFALFDMSAISFIDDTSPTETPTTDTTETASDLDSKDNIPHEDSAAVPVDTQKDTGAIGEIKALLEKMPKQFFSNLKTQVVAQSVPISVHSPHSPSYSKPLQYYVKIKRIHLKPTRPGKEGNIQPISMRIFGEVHDKKSGEVLYKYYDSAETSYVAGSHQAEAALDLLASQLMKDFSLFLKTMY